MRNAAEEIVNVWLQEYCGLFVMNNIVMNNTRGGGGKEIDFIATDGRGCYYWIEVSVSPNPFLPARRTRMRKIKENALKKFSRERTVAIKNRLGGKTQIHQKWFIYSPKLFTKTSDEENRYQHSLKKKGIKAISFEDVLKQTLGKLNFMGHDSPRQYLYIFKKFDYEH